MRRNDIKTHLLITNIYIMLHVLVLVVPFKGVLLVLDYTGIVESVGVNQRISSDTGHLLSART